MYTKPLHILNDLRKKKQNMSPLEQLFEATKCYMTDEEKEKYNPKKGGDKNEQNRSNK